MKPNRFIDLDDDREPPQPQREQRAAVSMLADTRELIAELEARGYPVAVLCSSANRHEPHSACVGRLCDHIHSSVQDQLRCLDDYPARDDVIARQERQRQRLVEDASDVISQNGLPRFVRGSLPLMTEFERRADSARRLVELARLGKLDLNLVDPSDARDMLRFGDDDDDVVSENAPDVVGAWPYPDGDSPSDRMDTSRLAMVGIDYAFRELSEEAKAQAETMRTMGEAIAKTMGSFIPPSVATQKPEPSKPRDDTEARVQQILTIGPDGKLVWRER